LVTVSGPIPMSRRHRCSIGLEEDMEEREQEDEEDKEK
jgi:hypothetical protein